MRGGSGELHIFLNQHSVMENRDMRLTENVAVRVKSRSAEDNIVGLPLPGRAIRIDQRRVLPVNGCGHIRRSATGRLPRRPVISTRY